MSSKYFKIYINENDENGVVLLRDIFSLIEKKSYNEILENYGNTSHLLVDYGESSKEIESIKYEMARILDFSVVEHTIDKSICFEFDSFTSLNEISFLEFFQKKGIKRVETIMYHSGVGEKLLMINNEIARSDDEILYIPSNEIENVKFIPICPACDSAAPVGDHWMCDSCDTNWNTFDTQGVCPTCNKQYLNTSCPTCGKSSLHEQWYLKNTINKVKNKKSPFALLIIISIVVFVIYKLM